MHRGGFESPRVIVRCRCIEATTLLCKAMQGTGSSSGKAILQCLTDPEHSIYLCFLSPDKTYSCSLNLEFDEDDNVTFSVIGTRSILPSRYFLTDDCESDGNDYETGSYEEGIADTDSGDLNEECDSEEEHDDDFTEEKPKAEKKNKKKHKKKAQEFASAAAVNEDQPIIDREDGLSKNKPSQVRTFPKGLVIGEHFVAAGQLSRL